MNPKRAYVYVVVGLAGLALVPVFLAGAGLAIGLGIAAAVILLLLIGPHAVRSWWELKTKREIGTGGSDGSIGDTARRILNGDGSLEGVDDDQYDRRSAHERDRWQ